MYYLTEFCRLCLSLEGEFNNMWLDDIMEKVTACISDLDFDSNLPLLICNKCLEKVEDFFEFRNQCLQSEFFINGYIDKLVNDVQGCKQFFSTALKVNLTKNFGSSNKYKGNVYLRKSVSGSDETVSNNKCNVYLRDFLKPWQTLTNTSKVTDDIVSNPPSEYKKTNHVVETKPIGACITNSVVKSEVIYDITNKPSVNNSNVVITLLDGDDDVFIEEEDEYSYQEPIKPHVPTRDVKKVVNANIVSTKDVKKVDTTAEKPVNSVANLDLHDPQNLLVDNGQERPLFDIQTDVSERVKLRKRKSQIKSYYQDSSYIPSKKHIARKSTTPGNKKSHSKRSSKANKAGQNLEATLSNEKSSQPNESNATKEMKSQARKSTTKSWTNLKKTKVSSANRDLWKAACRNWALQRMQRSGHVRNSPNTARGIESDSIKKQDRSSTIRDDSNGICSLTNSIQINHKSALNFETNNMTIATTVECKDLPDGDTNYCEVTTKENEKQPVIDLPKKCIRPPRIKTVKELNELLEQQHQRFNENLSNEYGIVIEDEGYSGMMVETGDNSKWNLLENTNLNEFKTPQILNTFSLSDQEIWDSEKNDLAQEILFENDFEVQEKFQTGDSDLCNQIIINSSFPSSIQQKYVNLDNAQQNIIEQQIIFNQPLEPSTEFVLAGNSVQQIIKSPPKTYKSKSKNNAVALNPLDTIQLQIMPQDVNFRQESMIPGVKEEVEKASVTDFEGAMTAHYIASETDDGKTSTQRIPAVCVKPLNSSRSRRKPTQYKIKTTNNIILIDSDKIPRETPTEEKLYKSNFGNLLQHYLTSDPPHKKLSYRGSPVKIVVPRKHMMPPNIGKVKKKLDATDSSSSNSAAFIHTIRKNWLGVKDVEVETPKTQVNKNGTFLNTGLEPVPEQSLINDLVTKTPRDLLKGDAVVSDSESLKMSRTKTLQSTPDVSVPSFCTDLKTENNDSDVILIEDSPPPSNLSNIAENETDLLSDLNSSGFPQILSTDTQKTSDESKGSRSSVNSPNEEPSLTLPDILSDVSLEIEQPKLKQLSPAFETEFSERGSKRRSSCEETPASPKSMRASSEESDALVIDDSPPRSHLPENICFPTPPKEVAPINPTGLKQLEITMQKEELPEANVNVKNNKMFEEFDNLGEGSSTKRLIQECEVAPCSNDLLHEASNSGIHSNAVSKESLQNTEKAQNIDGEKGPSNSSRIFPDLCSAGLNVCLDIRQEDSKQLDQPDGLASVKSLSDRTKLLCKNNAKFFESLIDKSPSYFKSLIDGLESPPPSPRTSSVKISSQSSKSSSPTFTSGSSGLLEDIERLSVLTCEKNLATVDLAPSSACTAVSSINPKDATSQDISALLCEETSMGGSISSDSDSAYVDVEAVSDYDDDDERSFSPLFDILGISDSADYEKNRYRCKKEQDRRRLLNKDLKALYDLIDENHSEGKSLDAVLRSAKNYIHSLELKFDKLDNEYHYLKAKQDYLLQTVSQLKKI